MNEQHLIGYARVSTEGQSLESQIERLSSLGCQRIFEEKSSGANRDRPQLKCLLDHLRSGDVVVVTRLDRLARSTGDLLQMAEQIKTLGAGLRSLAEPWADTTTPAGRMVLTIFAGIADFERALINERTSSGRAAAKARGIRFGPKPSLSPDQIAHARQLQDQGQPISANSAAFSGASSNCVSSTVSDFIEEPLGLSRPGRFGLTSSYTGLTKYAGSLSARCRATVV